MRAALYYSNRDIRIEERPLPKIGDGEMLLRVMASGVCGSDVMEWYRIKRAPLVLGHEIAAEVVEVGRGVARYRVGDRVSASHHVPCNTCYYCRNGHHTACDTLRTTNFDPGGFAEFLRLPAINVDRGVYAIPERLSWEEATFTEPLACVVRGQRRGALKAGTSLCIIGCGIMGLLHIKLARARGAGAIVATDISPLRIAAAKRMGAHDACDARQDLPARIRAVNDGRLADLVVVCTGAASAIIQSFACVERGGCIMLFAPTEPGITIPVSVNELLWGNDVFITSSYAGAPPAHIEALELMANGSVEVKDMITHRLPLSQTAEAFRLVEKADSSIKVIVEPQR